MSRLSFQEKMLYAQLVGLMVVVAYYAHFLVHQQPGQHWFHALLLGVFLFFLATHRLLRRGSGNTVEDERDQQIAAIGTRWSNMILWVGLLSLLVKYWDNGGLRSKEFMVGLIFHLLVLAGVVRIIRELVAYRTAA